MQVLVQSKVAVQPRTSAVVRLVDEYFYMFMSVFIAGIVTYGFSRTVDHNLIHSAVRKPAMLWVHGIVFSGWLAFFMVQSLLVRVRKVRLHRTLGWLGAAWGAAVIFVGVTTTFIMARFHVYQLHATDMSFLLVPLWDISCFAVCFGLAIHWRKRPEFHRRLLLIATCAIAAAGIGRFPEWIVPPGAFYVGVDLLILFGVARDLIVDRRIHAVYRAVLPVLVVGQALVLFVIITKPALWMSISSALSR